MERARIDKKQSPSSQGAPAGSEKIPTPKVKAPAPWSATASPVQRARYARALQKTIGNRRTGALMAAAEPPAQLKPNLTGLPDQLDAHAYARGPGIHIGLGREGDLTHQLGHVIQQKQGRVKPKFQAKGIPINDDASLEREADFLGAKAAAFHIVTAGFAPSALVDGKAPAHSRPVQRMQLYQGEPDAVILSNINFGFDVNQRLGVERAKEYLGPLKSDYTADNIDFDRHEVIFVHGHGDPGWLNLGGGENALMAEEAANEVVDRLKKSNDKPLKGSEVDIRVTSCSGAEDLYSESENKGRELVSPSLVEQIAKAFAEAGASGTVSGVKGPAFSYPGFDESLVGKKGGLTDQGIHRVFAKFKAWEEGERKKGIEPTLADRLKQLRGYKDEIIAVLSIGIQARHRGDETDLRLPGKDPDYFITKKFKSKI